MHGWRIPASVWKWLILLMAGGLAVLVASELHVGLGARLPDGEGSLRVTLEDQLGARPQGLGTHWLTVAALDPRSPLAAAGVRPGERLRFDRPLDRWRRFAPGERVDVTLDSGRSLRLTALPTPVGLADRTDYIGRTLIVFPALLFTLAIGWHQPAQRAYRSLSMMFLAMSAAFFYSFWFGAADGPSALGKLVQLPLNCLAWYFAADFALHYAAQHTGHLRHWLAHAMRFYRPLALASAAYTAWFALGHEAPWLWVPSTLSIGGGALILFLSLVDGWRSGRGDLRQRYRWLVLGLMCGGVPPLLTMLPWLDWETGLGRITVLAYFGGQFLTYCLLGYAVMRYRVFDFYLAVNRVVVFGVVSLLLLCTFGMLQHWVAHHVSAGHSGFGWQLLSDAAPAVLVFLVFNKLHARVEHAVHAVVFRRWAAREAQLREWLAAIVHIRSSDTLVAGLAAALDRFGDHAGSAVYLRLPDGGFALAASATGRFPPRIGPNDPLAVLLRADLAPTRHQLPQDAGVLALPMCHRAQLHGIVLLGARPNGESWRPDEITLLADTASQAGLGLQALRVDELQQAVGSLHAQVRRRSVELQAAAGRRRFGMDALP
ncbi:hypothetical protein [Massilia sp. 9I]|uniref:hypothetical protein n=1 Tax=Massilia sp. 9I TaxID=2653152 RepID=UPI0012F2A7F0|nr:hypothetical protein [Massilia sp. 9I]VXB59560.1 conserved membrane hypothetical protein [Massilia sp. 9I]